MRRLSWGVLAATIGCGDIAERSTTPEPRIEQVRGLDEIASRMLAHVPADTPYVWLEAEPLPEAYVDRLAPLVNATLAVWGRALDQPLSGDPELVALAEAFRGHMSQQGLRELGFDTNPHAVLYGIGLAPVLRVQLADGTKVARLLERVDAADGDIGVRTIDGHPVWAAAEDQLAAAVAVVDDELVIAAYPPVVQDDVLPMIVGARLPERSLAQTDWLRTARRTHDLLPHGVGAIDLVRVLAIVSGEGDATTRAITRAWSATMDDEKCGDALKSWFGHAPRVWFGLRDIGARRIETATIWETDEALRDELAEIVAPIAGLGRDEGLASLAVGIDVGEAIAMIERWRDDDRLAACRSSSEALGTPPAWLAGLHGGSAVMQGWDPLRDEVSGTLVLGVDDPRHWLASIMPSADLDELKRRPVRSKAVLGSNAWGKDAWIARSRHAIGLAIGEHAKQRLRRAIDRERDDDRTLVSWSFDVHGLVAALPRAKVREALERRGEVERAWIEAMLDLVQTVRGAIVVGQHGVEIGATVEL